MHIRIRTHILGAKIRYFSDSKKIFKKLFGYLLKFYYLCTRI